MIDAEYTYMNPALRLFSIALMLIHNKYTPLVAYTYQNYLKVSLFLFLFHLLLAKCTVARYRIYTNNIIIMLLVHTIVIYTIVANEIQCNNRTTTLKYNTLQPYVLFNFFPLSNAKTLIGKYLHRVSHMVLVKANMFCSSIYIVFFWPINVKLFFGWAHQGST